ncbi:MAG: Twitching motility protein [Actinobacteria bacterium 66_15]|nr:MAG: Twitching motility protein [Actinobacteria bacterium 66_15]
MTPTRVLIVHDDAAFYERAKQGIAEAFPGAEVTGAISAPRALGIAKQQKPDVVIADGDLMGMDGYQFTSELKADAEMAATPVLIVANQPNEASALKARQVGAAGHLPATVDTATLVQKISSVLMSDGGQAVQQPAATVPPATPVDPLGAQAGSGPVPGVPAAPAPQPTAGTPSASPAWAAYPGPAAAPAQPGSPPQAARPAPGNVGAIGGGGPVGDIPNVDDLLRHMIDVGGSDLHITVGSPPGIRLRGEVAPIEGQKVLTPKDTQEMLLSLLSEEQRRRFETELELDFAYSIPGLSRFRTNVFQQRNSMGAVFRVIPLKIPTLEELQLPRVCKFLAERPRGLVLVTGPTGSGKSTTLAAMIDHINETRPVHIITLEDPIEFMHKNKRAYVNQREIGEDTHSFTSALKRVLRQDPDVILVGEMRDLETISAALTAAETGHLVLATLHTTGGPETVDRIIDVFPPHQQQQVRMQLSTTLEGVLSQTLLRSTDGRSRVMAMEIMLGIPAISNLIREGKTHQMATIIQGGSSLGMQTLDQHLKVLLQAGKVTYEEAIQKAKEPRELAQMLGRKM